ncbi:AbrB/MazE/SpoVT family DNA-binding domain-containing protein [Robbsia sp. Bb-Pol-6]|uniref:AbrB/MazE/SpoVT family DNA-binding domain-containing protein n=1 Tax=Robbsia betulipollinis TaxID=2981849 RepID=A0ABT3ZRT5_9BURK|nr:AbrB/MazE/SpoVT family DNA-binding domain-containing protein [Robbsia betulipollinis]MCY0389266.1 AbrB/MazE/SpoVT family DNA-binding domain-containing protein [Robbsia betulipollinis]
MSVLSQKRQITLPKALCERLLVQPGDDLMFLEHRGRITIVKKEKGGSDGILHHLKGDAPSDEESLHDAVAKKYGSRTHSKRVA